MNYAFLDTLADFDPAAFRLPDTLKQVQGPESLPPVPLSPEVANLEKQLEREADRTQQAPSPVNQQVSQNLAQQLQLSLTDERAAQAKALLIRLKALPASCPQTEIRQALLDAIETLKSNYAGARCPKDLATMSVLHPLLKCQESKWEALQASQSVHVPAVENSYLQKLRQLKGSLGPVEKASLFQLILAINQHLVTAFAPAAASPADENETPLTAAAGQAETTPEKVSETTPDAAPALQTAGTLPVPVAAVDFDPLKASRELMQLRSKLQRTFSPQEKQTLQAQIQDLMAQQSAYFGQRQIQALAKQTQEFMGDQTRFRDQKITGSGFETWRKLRLTGLQSLARLLTQTQAAQGLMGYCESAQRQLARLGLADARDWIATEQRAQAAFAPECTPEFNQAGQSWRQAFEQMLERALECVQSQAAQAVQRNFKARLEAIEQVKVSWQTQQARIQSLEQTYLQCADPVQAHQIRQKLLQAYAELLAQLAELTRVQA